MVVIPTASKSPEQTATDSPGRCRICNSGVGHEFAANGFAWLRCATCRTTQKILTHQQYRELNPTYDPGAFLDSQDRKQVEDFLDLRAAMKVLSDVVDAHLDDIRATSPSRTFLDVGCGMGQYLLAAQRLGFEVLGFEPSVDHARVAIQHFNLPVIEDYFSTERLDGKTFDLIMLSHVIEHIYEPRFFIHKLVDALKPGGALIVITPNNESLVAHIVGRAWPMLKPVDHVSLIGPTAYAHFDLDRVADTYHSSSEYPFEFAASALAALKSLVSTSRRDRSTHQERAIESAPPPLRGLGFKAKAIRYALSLASAPMYAAAVAARRRGCLRSIIVRRA
jgi:SAM-dependent methyltransferase